MNRQELSSTTNGKITTYIVKLDREEKGARFDFIIKDIGQPLETVTITPDGDDFIRKAPVKGMPRRIAYDVGLNTKGAMFRLDILHHGEIELGGAPDPKGSSQNTGIPDGRDSEVRKLDRVEVRGPPSTADFSSFLFHYWFISLLSITGLALLAYKLLALVRALKLAKAREGSLRAAIPIEEAIAAEVTSESSAVEPESGGDQRSG